jgi:hypothetical protein
MSTLLEYKGEQIEDEIPYDTELWTKIQKLKDEELAASARFLLKEKEGRKRVLSRDISLTSEQLQVMEDAGENEARATHSSTSAAMRNKKQKAADKAAKDKADAAAASSAASKDVGNWRPRVPRKGERPWSKQFSAEVDKLQSKKKLTDKITIFKNFHRELQDETFTYKNQNDQNRGRQDLLDVGEWLLENLDQSPYAERNLFFGSILFIIKRQEFNVCDMEFDVSLKPKFSSQTIITLLRYRKFLFDTQLFVQKKLQQPGSYAALLSFCASILAINYFYIEGLPDLLLTRCWPDARAAQVYAAHPHLKEYADFVQKADDAETLVETKQKDMYLGGSKSSPSIAYFCTLRSLFVALAAAASKKDQSELSALRLDTRALDADWLQRMVDGGDFFHIFLLEWLAQIAYFIGSYKKIRWGLIQGYYKWVSIVFLQMMTKPLAEWTEEFIQVSDSLLLNPKLLSVYIKITFRKTNVFVTEEVESTLRLVDGWIDLLPISVDETTGCIEPLHSTFDYAFFLNGLAVLFDSDHFVVLLEALLLLYNHLDRFVGVHRIALVDNFLLSPRIFAKLFLCWNHHVRHVYHLILVYKLARFRPELPGDSDGIGTIDPALAAPKTSAEQAVEFAARTAALVGGPSGRCGAAGTVGAAAPVVDSDDDDDDNSVSSGSGSEMGGAEHAADDDSHSESSSVSSSSSSSNSSSSSSSSNSSNSSGHSRSRSGGSEDASPLPPPAGAVDVAPPARTAGSGVAAVPPPAVRHVPPPPPPSGAEQVAVVKTSGRVPPPPPSSSSSLSGSAVKVPPPPPPGGAAAPPVAAAAKVPPPPPPTAVVAPAPPAPEADDSVSSSSSSLSSSSSSSSSSSGTPRVAAPPIVSPPPIAPPVVAPPPVVPPPTAPPPVAAPPVSVAPATAPPLTAPPAAASSLASDSKGDDKKSKKKSKSSKDEATSPRSPATAKKGAEKELGTKWTGAPPAAPPKATLDNVGLPLVLPPAVTPRSPDQLPSIIPPPMLSPTATSAAAAKAAAADGVVVGVVAVVVAVAQARRRLVVEEEEEEGVGRGRRRAPRIRAAGGARRRQAQVEKAPRQHARQGAPPDRHRGGQRRQRVGETAPQQERRERGAGAAGVSSAWVQQRAQVSARVVAAGLLCGARRAPAGPAPAAQGGVSGAVGAQAVRGGGGRRDAVRLYGGAGGLRRLLARGADADCARL